MIHKTIADQLITPLWRGIPTEYKQKYSLSIWQQFENQIKSAAYTSRLEQFLQSIKTRLDIVILESDVPHVVKFLGEAQPKEIMNILRHETALVVLMVRLENEQRREKFKETAKKPTESAKTQQFDRDFKNQTTLFIEED